MAEIKGRERDFLDFAGERAAVETGERPWKILIVDDEEEVHTLTRLVLKNYTFEGRGIEMISAYSGAQARPIVRDDPEIALILLDVVMESENSGLRLVRHIRDELGNKNVRIILRTGQPGQAPELEVVAQYDINDYKAKVELTAQKLYTAVTSSLRSWRDIQIIEESRRGLQRVLDASAVLFDCPTRAQFITSVLDELMVIAGRKACRRRDDVEPTVGAPAGKCSVSGLAARCTGDEQVILAARGRFGDCRGRPVSDVVPESTELMIEKATRQGKGFFFNHSFVSCIKGENGQGVLFLLKGEEGLYHLDADLINIYMANVAMAFHNVNLSREIIDTQKEIIHTLGEVVETRSKETANHVLRVGKMAESLGRRVGLSVEDASILRLAAPMHDVGKVGVSDAILNKPGRLTADEYGAMQEHARIGHEILGKSERRIMRSAAEVALQHHERWDGGGYPNGLAGRQIGLFSRITALVDVFDALANHRVYREAWELKEVLDLLRAERGKHFDPELVDVFLANLDDFVGIIREHPDVPAAASPGDPAAAEAAS